MTSHRIYSGSGLTYGEVNGPIESMDADDARMRAAWSKVGRALPWIIATGLALGAPILWHLIHAGWRLV